MATSSRPHWGLVALLFGIWAAFAIPYLCGVVTFISAHDRFPSGSGEVLNWLFGLG